MNPKLNPLAEEFSTEMFQANLADILTRESEAVRAIPLSDNYIKAVQVIVDRVAGHGGKLIVSGMGKAGQIGMNIATTFCSTGTPAVFLHPAEAQHGDLGIIQKNDLLLLISNSGKTREVLELLELAQALNPGLPVIVITGDTSSPLADVADILLPTGGAAEVCPLGLTPTVSTTVMTVIGDLLVVSVMNAIGFTRQEYARRHHGGYLGQAARK